ncbi:MAG TPA: methyltransferase domain-containing protein [Candidatus Binatia bacterium]|nr:methyltransferase domain-containing protein [Candidatus Binatia bacterium]
MASDAWNPAQYARFGAERRQPFDDLVRLVRPAPAMRIVDLGCGPGELTAELHDRLAARSTIGIDSSPAMLERAAVHERPGLAFRQADIAHFAEPGAFDLVFSNAAIHWVPDHRELLARLAAALAPGGQLAVQMPANFDHPSHTVAREIAGEQPFARALAGVDLGRSVLRPDEYASLLDGLGFVDQHVRLQVYPHHLESPAEVVEWIRGTGLTAYESRLTPERFQEFLACYRDRLLPRLGDRRPYFYPFKRILFWGRLAGAPAGAGAPT